MRFRSLARSVACLVALLLLLVPSAHALEDPEWPKEIARPDATITVYQPQVERFEGNELEARAAVSVARGGGSPEFGAIWITARVDGDRDDRMLTWREVKVPRVRFPEASEADQKKLAQVLEEAVPEAGLTLTMDRLITELDPPEKATEDLRHDPPLIRYRPEPTVLITLDGDPVFQEVEGHPGVEQVVNTPFTMLRTGDALYLAAGGGHWYRAGALEGPWTPDVAPPAALRGLEPEDAHVEREEGRALPAVMVATEPTELIVSDGAPSWTPVAGGKLLYLDNTDSDVFLEVASQRYFVLLSGRWYAGKAMGDHWAWEHVPNDRLPASFAEIPADSTNGHVRPMVAGTPEARDAILDQSVPQTAAVKREGGPPLQIEYDGRPKFEPIEGVPAKYAVNTPSAVFELGDHYWACEQGIWYDANTPVGPWRVATEVPDVLSKVPPSNPHHNVTYVKVYDTTPDVVYVGYTPGYVGSYVYAGSVVYGTGWAYTPWLGSVYYPRVPTWGFHVSYNPWTGWGFGVSWRNGPFSFSVGFGGGGWFGPVGYRPWGRPYVGGGFRKTDIDIDRSIHIGDIDIDRSRRADLDVNQTDIRSRVDNVYDRGANRDRVADAGAGLRDRAAASDRTRPAGRPNDVLTDRDGNVFRRDADGSWQQRADRDWKPAQGLDRPTARDLQGPSGATRDLQGPSGATRDLQRPSGATRDLQRPSGTTRDLSRPSGTTRDLSRPSGTTRDLSGAADRLGSASRSRDLSAARRPQLESAYRSRSRGASRSAQFQSMRSRGGGLGRR